MLSLNICSKSLGIRRGFCGLRILHSFLDSPGNEYSEKFFFLR